MASILAGLLSGVSAAALAVFARLVSRPVLEKIIEKLIIAAARYVDDKTESPLVAELRLLVEKELGGEKNTST